MDIRPLRKRASFVRASAQGEKFITPAFIMLRLPDPESEAGEETAEEKTVRVGYTVTKKLGGAVVRNRIRRRLREAVRMVAEDSLAPGCAYVLIARNKALQCPFSELMRDIRFAARRIGRVKPQPGSSPAS